MAKSIVEYTEKLNQVFFKDGNVATVEDTSTASKAYAVGDLVIVAAVMYRVTAAVAKNGTLISGVNITQTTVEELLAGKVDKVVGKGLSTNDYTTAEKQKLAGLSNYDDTDVRNLIAGKQNQLTFDTTPTASSTNPVTSGGVKSALDGKQATISGGASTIASSNLTASRALVSNSAGKVAVSAVTSTELNYLDGATSNLQTQLNGKQDTINGAVTSVTKSNLTTNRVVISNSSGKLAASSISSTKLGYLTDVTSNIQAQLNKKWTFSTELTLGTNSEIHEEGDTVAQGGLTVGQDLQLPDTGEIICGQHSADASNAYFVVGTGVDSYSRHNALVVDASTNVIVRPKETNGYSKSPASIVWMGCVCAHDFTPARSGTFNIKSNLDDDWTRMYMIQLTSAYMSAVMSGLWIWISSGQEVVHTVFEKNATCRSETNTNNPIVTFNYPSGVSYSSDILKLRIYRF